MGILERLDAADRSFGVGVTPLRKAPSRSTRWIVSHPCLWGFVFATPWLLFWVARVAMGEAGLLWMLCPLPVVPMGYLQTVQWRRQVEQWDAEHPATADTSVQSSEL
jgi:hypothetical protein